LDDEFEKLTDTAEIRGIGGDSIEDIGIDDFIQSG
jgi:hypothetical protein